MARSREVPTPVPQTVLPAVIPQATSPPTSLTNTPRNSAAEAFLRESQGDREQMLKLPIISIHHKDAMFVLPSGEMVPQISGYIIRLFQTRKFYARSPQPGMAGLPPDCWSGDLLKPHDSSRAPQAELCAGCPMNEFGTARDGRGKACATMTWLFLLNPEFGSPPIGMLIVPPSSIRPIMGTKFQPGYISQATARHGVYEIVWTTFTLKQMGEQIQYCVVEPHMGEAAALERAKEIAHFRNQYFGAMNSYREVAGTIVERERQPGDDDADSEGGEA